MYGRRGQAGRRSKGGSRVPNQECDRAGLVVAKRVASSVWTAGAGDYQARTGPYDDTLNIAEWINVTDMLTGWPAIHGARWTDHTIRRLGFAGSALHVHATRPVSDNSTLSRAFITPPICKIPRATLSIRSPFTRRSRTPATEPPCYPSHCQPTTPTEARTSSTL